MDEFDRYAEHQHYDEQLRLKRDRLRQLGAKPHKTSHPWEKSDNWDLPNGVCVSEQGALQWLAAHEQRREEEEEKR
jgi:hypothetical protein